MHKLLAFCLSLLLAVPAFAAEPAAQEPGEVVVHKVEKQLHVLPSCDDTKLLTAVKGYIAAYFDKNKEGSAVFRRRRYFIMHNLADFAKENIANYKTETSRPISDIIIDLKINHNVLEENMLLCKNQSQYDAPGKIYLLVHPEGNGYRVYVINLQKPETPLDEISFVYE